MEVTFSGWAFTYQGFRWCWGGFHCCLTLMQGASVRAAAEDHLRQLHSTQCVKCLIPITMLNAARCPVCDSRLLALCRADEITESKGIGHSEDFTAHLL